MKGLFVVWGSMLFSRSIFKTFSRALVDGMFGFPNELLEGLPPDFYYLIDNEEEYLIDNNDAFLFVNIPDPIAQYDLINDAGEYMVDDAGDSLIIGN